MNPSLPRRTPPSRRGGGSSPRAARHRRRAATRTQSARTLVVLIAVLIAVATLLITQMAARAEGGELTRHQQTPQKQAAPSGGFAPVPVAPVAPLWVSVTVRTMRDNGGLPTPIQGDAPLNVRLTKALTTFLRDSVPNRPFDVLTTGAKGQAVPVAPVRRFTLEGDLTGANLPPQSRLGLPESDGSGYLCIARLYEEADKTRRRRRRLIGQWAGTADTLRYLSGNLGRDTRVSPLGLVGEMGGRIAAVLTAVARDPEVALDALAAQTKNRPFDARLVPVPGEVEVKQGGSQLAPLNRQQVQMETREAGQAFLIEMRGDTDTPFLVSRGPSNGNAPQEPDPSAWFAAGAFTLPAPPRAPIYVGGNGVYLVFRRTPAPPPPAQTARATPPLLAAAAESDEDEPEDLTGHTGLTMSFPPPPLDLSRAPSETDAPPVRVVGIVVPLRDPARSDPALVALLARIAQDAPGVWSALRVGAR